MKCIRITFFLALTGLISLNLLAQPEQKIREKRERLKALKVAFITEALDLSSKEAQAFWPIYNELNDELEAERKDHWKQRDKMNAIDELSDKEVEQLIEDDLAHDQRMLDVKREYLNKFKDVLPIKKIAKLHKAERDFNRKVLEEFKRREGGMRGEGPPAKRF